MFDKIKPIESSYIAKAKITHRLARADPMFWIMRPFPWCDLDPGTFSDETAVMYH